jgi:hypothetical protein
MVVARLSKIPMVVFLLACIVAGALSCAGAKDEGRIDLLPKGNLPEGMHFSASWSEKIPKETDTESPLGYKYENVVTKNVVSAAGGEYEGMTGKAYVIVIECQDEDAAQLVLESFINITLVEGVFEVSSVEFNGHVAVKGYAPSSSEYVYLRQADELVFEVVGISESDTLELAKATGY